ncbi:hypothetical protein Cp1R7AA1_166 [Mesorhizobium phage Cp1R7A-A1]|nr:hypothetical protein Cp1R7AA1_166 [Mesorhizobium phage Cp1R7A-A1]
MTPYHDALSKCAVRYMFMNYETGAAQSEPLSKFIKEFAQGCFDGLPVPKLCRWLGYIQGVLIERGLTTVQEERDWTRPLFRPLDFA